MLTLHFWKMAKMNYHKEKSRKIKEKKNRRTDRLEKKKKEQGKKKIVFGWCPHE